MEDTSEYCRDCKMTTEVVYDRSSGDTICRECGLVLEAYAIDDTCEWRSFAADCSTSEDRDPSRVGAASNPLLTHDHLSTNISKPIDSSAGHCGAGSNPEKTLISGFKAIESMCDRLSIVATIKNRACEIYKKLEDNNKLINGRKSRHATLAACLYIACILEHTPRTLKEICSITNGATRKEICFAKRCIEHRFAELAVDAVGTTIHASDIVGRFCSNLSLNYRTIKAAQEALKELEQLVVRRNPITSAAAVIYMIIQLSSDDKKDLQDISTATGSAVNTIRSAYKDVYPYAPRLIPSWYAPQEALKNLSAP